MESLSKQVRDQVYSQVYSQVGDKVCYQIKENV